MGRHGPVGKLWAKSPPHGPATLFHQSPPQGHIGPQPTDRCQWTHSLLTGACHPTGHRLGSIFEISPKQVFFNFIIFKKSPPYSWKQS
jgi:hypothetical protein